jgi:hypothetical protein
LGPIPNPQSPIPNSSLYFFLVYFKYFNINLILLN